MIWQADRHKYVVTQVEGKSTVLKYELFAFLYSSVCCKLPVGPVYSLPTCSRLKIRFYLKSFQFTIHSDVILHKHLRELTATPTHLQEEVAFWITFSSLLQDIKHWDFQQSVNDVRSSAEGVKLQQPQCKCEYLDFSRCGDMNEFMQSHCGDASLFREKITFLYRQLLHFRMKTSRFC